MVSLSYFIKNSTITNNVLHIPLLDDTIGKFVLLEAFMHICLPLIEEVLAIALSGCTVHRIDVCPYKRTWWWIHSLMCVKSVYSGPSSYQEMLVWSYYFVFQVDNIGSDQSILFHFDHAYMGAIQAILEWGEYVYVNASWFQPLLGFSTLAMYIAMFGLSANLSTVV